MLVPNLLVVLVLVFGIHARCGTNRWRTGNGGWKTQTVQRGRNRNGGLNRRGRGNPPRTYFENNPDEQNDEDNERNVKRTNRGPLEDFKYTWFDPYADRPIMNMTRDNENYLRQVDAERKEKCGIRQRRWKRQATNTRVSTRKEYRMLTPAERTRFHNAVRRLKDTGGYDALAMMHRNDASPGAHNGSSFLLWHRQYCLQFETALQEIDPQAVLPYWENIYDSRLGNRYRDSCLFDSYSLGRLTGAVTDGAFANFRAVAGCENLGSIITRQIGSNGFYTSGDLREYDGYTRFQQIAGTLDFENQHGLTHVSIGGHMGNLNCSPNDPLFFLYHAFIDYLFHRFRNNQGSIRETDYVNNPGTNHRLTDTMRPFGMTVQQGLRDIPAVTYEDSISSTACTSTNGCTADMLFCHNSRCTAKIKQRTRCVNNMVASCYCPPGSGAPSCARRMCTCGGGTTQNNTGGRRNRQRNQTTRRNRGRQRGQRG